MVSSRSAGEMDVGTDSATPAEGDELDILHINIEIVVVST